MPIEAQSFNMKAIEHNGMIHVVHGARPLFSHFVCFFSILSNFIRNVRFIEFVPEGQQSIELIVEDVILLLLV